ncbi:CLUMA_CG009854, isoform A [Clunio marinus]|uniref:Eukaryotic translation initiation factor 3 subunit J n=1 Tax=Clunio marinus TaxID=568069 RepID=A0A1J1IBS2_9DIPT|nr:CLUMA_CG009854, isoform A [Clunio marinus]
MEDDWQRIADDSIKPTPIVIPADVNKWAGEDEEDDIKDSWDAEDDDEKKDEEKNDNAPLSKPKKKLQQKISEKERQKLELEEKRRKEKEEEEYAKMTPEEREAEKRRLQKLQEEADTRTALDTLGLSSSSSATIDSFNPKTKEDFMEFAELLNRRIQIHKLHEEYVPFLDELVKGLCAGLQSTNIKKIKTTVDNLFIEKQKIEKGDKPKKKPAAKIKARLRMEGDDDFMTRAGAYEADDYDDFM